MSSNTFAKTVALIKQFALEKFDQAIATQQLYYHNRWHIEVVQRRAKQIMTVVAPYWSELETSDSRLGSLIETEHLLDLCVTSHDVVQIFLPCSHPHSSRRRESGQSEQATFELLQAYIDQHNKPLDSTEQFWAPFSDQHLALLKSAILGTICAYVPEEVAIFQPALYNAQCPPDMITRILALADIGALGMDGLRLYNQEGSLLFLEENPDIIPFIQTQTTDRLLTEQPELAENFRQRLLKRARWQVSFARSRFARTPQELAGFPNKTIPLLREKAFPHLNTATLRELEATTPTAASSSLPELFSFFQLDQYLTNPVECIPL